MKPISRMIPASSGDADTFWCGRPFDLSACWSDSRPFCSRSSRACCVNHCRILLRARDVFTRFIQSRDGPRSCFDVSTSTNSPDWSV